MKYSTEAYTADSVRDEVFNVLRGIAHPSSAAQHDIVYSGLIKRLNVRQNSDTNNFVISLDLELDRHFRDLKKQISEVVAEEMRAKSICVESIRVNMAAAADNKHKATQASASSSGSSSSALKNVKRIVAVASCKGGVGKSSCCVNVAYTLSKLNYKVGIFDADIYGPSLPTLTSAAMYDQSNEGHLRQDLHTQLIYPMLYEGVKLMSFGYVKDSFAAMRGPMVTNVIQQLLFGTDWGHLDYLLVDMPPGTNDIHITLSQKLHIDGALVVTTPQQLSLIDVVKGIEMFNKVNVPTLAVIKNMTHYVCTHCGSKQDIFNATSSTNKGRSIDWQHKYGIEHVFELPVYPLISQFSDYGDPIVLNKDTVVSPIFEAIANCVVQQLSTEQAGAASVHPYEWQIDTGDRKIKFVHSALQTQTETETQSQSQSEWDFVALRAVCKCALCVDELTNAQILKKEDIDKDIRINHVKECGRYAVEINWSDGHSSIYSLNALFNLTDSQ